MKAHLKDATLEHDAHVQCIDEAKTTFQGQQGTEMNFRDTWKFNVAVSRASMPSMTRGPGRLK